MARDFATTEGIPETTGEHCAVGRYLRGYSLTFDIAPMVRKRCMDTGFNLAHLYDLFPSGPSIGACKAAGLPKPTGRG